ncbi:MAG: adenylosuccinate synthetase [Nitrospiraceae bacterium]
MPVSVVVGGQFGSEGKGKVALELARLRGAAAAIRVGGPNSGHTAIDATGKAHVFRHLPTAALLPDVTCVIGAGSYIDADVLLDEVARTDLSPSRVLIDPWAVLIEPKHREQERQSGLRERIGSTLSGTGAAVAARVQRNSDLLFAKDEPRLEAFVRPVKRWLRPRLREGERVIIEGTQGFGLSLLHSEHYPHVTSRDTTAAGFVAEAGLSPLDVDEIVLVIRAFPIRVAGASGELPGETNWTTVTQESGSPVPLEEITSVTRRIRRVARFDADVVRRAIEVNAPSLICLNHVDHVDVRSVENWTPKAEMFLCGVESALQHRVDYVGSGASTMIPRPESTRMVRAG